MDISYEIIRSPRRHRTITLQITEGRLVVRAPWFATEEAIQRFCQRRRTWIEEMLRSITPLPVAERDPHPIWYLGIAYPTVLTDKTTVCLHNGRFLIPREGSRTAIEAWFITRARAYVPLRVQYYTTLAGYTPRAIRIGRARSRWGSCSGDNRLTFTWRLLAAPPEVIDYVVCHELAHLREHNHSSRFWSLVEGLYPRYREARHWLKSNGRLITFG